MNIQVSDLSDAQHDVLELLYRNNGMIDGYSKVAKERETARSSAKELVEGMAEDPALVNLKPSKNATRIEFTDLGKQVVEKAPYGGGKPNTQPNTESLERLHGFVVQARVMTDVPEDWMGVLQEHDELTFLKRHEGDWIAARNRWVIRMHKDSVTLQLREGCSISGDSSAEVFRKAHSQARDVGSWLEVAAGISVQLKHFVVTRAELGFEGHPLAVLADKLEDIPLSRFKVIDEDLQKEVLGMDKSPGIPELESKSGEQSERIAQSIEAEMEQHAHRPEAVQRRHSVENEMLVQGVSGQELVHGARQGLEVGEQVRETASQVNRVREELSDMREVIQDNKRTREALHEQVRAINNLAQTNQKRLESQRQAQKEEEVDIVEKTVRDVINDEEFSRPGLQYGHLMAWRDGECVKILDKSVVEKSESEFLDLIGRWKP